MYSWKIQSGYLTLIHTELPTVLGQYHKYLKTGHISINSIVGFKFIELKTLILDSLLDLIVISETKVDNASAFPDWHFFIKGFRQYRKDRNHSGGGQENLLCLEWTTWKATKPNRALSVCRCLGEQKDSCFIGAYIDPQVYQKKKWENSILLCSTQ